MSFWCLINNLAPECLNTYQPYQPLTLLACDDSRKMKRTQASSFLKLLFKIERASASTITRPLMKTHTMSFLSRRAHRVRSRRETWTAPRTTTGITTSLPLPRRPHRRQQRRLPPPPRGQSRRRRPPSIPHSAPWPQWPRCSRRPRTQPPWPPGLRPRGERGIPRRPRITSRRTVSGRCHADKLS